MTIPTNMPYFLRKWAEESGSKHTEKNQIIVEMLKKFLPDIFLYDLHYDDLFDQIKANLNTIKMVVLWKGSPPVNMEIFKKVDLTISCAPEEVKSLRGMGFKIEHLHHAFNKNILNGQLQANKEFELIFIGQIYRAIGFHTDRDRMLKQIVKEMEINVFSPSYELGFSDFLYHLAKKSALTLLLPFYFISDKFSNKYSIKLEKAREYQFFPYSLKFKKSLQPAGYEKKMYDVIRSSKDVLNIHADSSPQFAFNMKLFETTGVGSCLLTDWKENINQLFEEDEEIVTYRSPEECVQKAKWLLANSKERGIIAKKGQQRTFASHLYEHRVPEFLSIIKKHLE